MASTTVNNPTNAPPRKGQALPFIRRATESNRLQETANRDEFNSGKDYKDEGAPLLTAGMTRPVAPAVRISNSLIAPPTREEMEALAHPDEQSQTQITNLREAVVMDIDAKLIISSVDQMKRGIFRECHYPTLIDYMKSPHYKRLREARIIAERVSGLAKSTRLREAGQSTVAGVRLNPNLVNLYNSVDRQISRRLKESGFDKNIAMVQKRFREDFPQDIGNFGQPTSTAGQIEANWDGGNSFALAGREPDYIPLMSGPYNKQLYYFDYLDMHSKAFEAANHNPIAKRIITVITQFVLGKGVRLTVMRAVRKSEERAAAQPQPNTQRINTKAVQEPVDWKVTCQGILDRHWVKNAMHIRSKQILKDLLIFGENFIRYFGAPWGLKVREIDPSTVWEVITDPDDCENEFYIHQQFPTKYQWFVDLPVPTIKFIIRQVPSALYYHMKINCTAGEVRGRSELFAILGWLKRLKEYASDRVVRNKIANLFVIDVAVEGDATAVALVQQQLAATPPTPGSFFFHNKAAELESIRAEIGASDTQGDWEMLLTVIAAGAGISREYLGLASGSGGKAQALVGTEPDIKSFEDKQEIMENFFLQDSERVFERAKEQKEIPNDLSITVEATYPALAEENRSEKLKDLAFGESMSWWSHRRVASASAKEMQMTSYDYDEEQKAIATEDAQKEFLINTAYQQVVKGTDSATATGTGGGSSSGSSGKGASGMGMGKALPTSSKQSESLREVEEDEDEDEAIPATAPGTSSGSNVSGRATTHNASTRQKELPKEWRGADVDESSGRRDHYRGSDPRDVASSIKREAANLRYERREIGRSDRHTTPDKRRDQTSMDRGAVVTQARKALKSGHFNKEAAIRRFPRYKESMEPFKRSDGDKLQKPRVETVPEHQGHPRGSGKRLSPSGYGANKKEGI